MHYRYIILAALLAVSVNLKAQSVAPYYKGLSDSNPISASVFCADPTALDYNGRLYVYGSNDHQQFIKNNKKDGNGYGDIKSLVVFSTDDMVNWTFHGTIDVAKICSSWSVGGRWWRGFFNSWAPSVTWRTTADGKDEFFLYFANNSHGVGVLKASSPIGPWTSPLKESMINRDTPGANVSAANFDPGVVIDNNGTAWIGFGGLGPDEGGTDINPKTARLAKLKPSMTAVDGSAVIIPAPYHFEASELNIMDGKFVYTYCSNWADRKDADWNAYKKAQNITLSKPATCTMCYMVSDDPMNSDSWVYKGVCGPHPGMPSPNNHSHLHKFQDKYVYFYHWAPLMQKMKDGKAIDDSADGYRSICVNRATVNEETQTINSVTQNLSGTTAFKKLNPYELQQAETMANSGGITYTDYTNISKNSSISSLGNDASRNMQVKMAAGSWTMVRGVDFGANGASSLMFRAKGTGKLEVRINGPKAKTAAMLEFSSADFEDHVITLDPAVFNGVKSSVIFLFSAATNVQFDAWQFTEAQTEGITPVVGVSSDSQTYDLSGRRINKNRSQHGIVVEQYTDANGVKRSRKVSAR